MRFRHMALMVGVTAVTSLGLVGGALAQSGLDKKSKPKIQKVALTPTSVGGNGGTVKLKVKVTGVTNPTVLAQVQLAGQNGGNAPSTKLTKSGSNTYSGNVAVAANALASVNRASVVVSATKSGKSTVKIIGYVKVGAGSLSPPPPPPSNFR